LISRTNNDFARPYEPPHRSRTTSGLWLQTEYLEIVNGSHEYVPVGHRWNPELNSGRDRPAALRYQSAADVRADLKRIKRDTESQGIKREVTDRP